MGYTKWQNFESVIEKAKTACKTAGNIEKKHFTDAGKMVNENIVVKIIRNSVDKVQICGNILCTEFKDWSLFRPTSWVLGIA